MKQIKWGIIGAGNISTKFATALKSLENTELVAIASRDLKKAKAFADKFQIQKAYGSYEELAEDTEIDVIYIGTPHTEHKMNAALCITNGKAVLCEKPFTINIEESQYLASLAKEHNVFLMEAMWTKFQPVTQVVKQWIKEKRIGEVVHFNVNFGFFIEFDKNHRLFDPNLGGGALLDLGVYPITYVIHMMDKLPDEIVSSVIMTQSNVDEQNTIIFKYENGVLASMCSSLSGNVGDEAIIVGNKGMIKVPNFWSAQTAQLFDENNNLIDTCSIPFDINGYEYEAREVNRCLIEGKTQSEVLPLKDTLDIMKLMDNIRKTWGLVYPQEHKYK